MRITKNQLRSIIRETLLSDHNTQHSKHSHHSRPITSLARLQEGIEELFDTGYDTETSSELRDAISKFKGSAPDIPVKYGSSYRDAAMSQNVNYYLYDNGKIQVGDTSFPDWPAAKTVLRQFKTALDEVIPFYTVIDGSGRFPDIDTDNIDNSKVKQSLLNYAKFIEASQLQKVKTIYKTALKVTGNDRAKAAAICYDGAKALPYILGVALFTRYGPNMSIKTKSQIGSEDAYARFRSVKLSPSSSTLTVYISISNPDSDDHSLAFCTPGGGPIGVDVVLRPVCFYNADSLPDMTVVRHEIDHAIHRIYNDAFSKHASEANQKSVKQDARGGDYIFEMNKEVIGELSPPSLPGQQSGGLVRKSTPQAKPYVDSAADFIKKNVKIGDMSAVSLAKLSFLVLGSIVGRDYNGVGDTNFDTAGNDIAPVSFTKGGEAFEMSTAYTAGDWIMNSSEIRNAVLNMFRRHRRLKKELGTQYTAAQDVRPYLAKGLTNTVNISSSQDLIEACILAALGPHPSTDFDKLAAVAAADQPAAGEETRLSENLMRRWSLLAGLR